MKTKKYCIEITDLTEHFMPTKNDLFEILFNHDKLLHCTINVYEG